MSIKIFLTLFFQFGSSLIFKRFILYINFLYALEK